MDAFEQNARFSRPMICNRISLIIVIVLTQPRTLTVAMKDIWIAKRVMLYVLGRLYHLAIYFTPQAMLLQDGSRPSSPLQLGRTSPLHRGLFLPPPATTAPIAPVFLARAKPAFTFALSTALLLLSSGSGVAPLSKHPVAGGL